MAKPILIVRFNPTAYTKDQLTMIKDSVFRLLKEEYHVFFISSEEVSEIKFEVVGQ